MEKMAEMLTNKKRLRILGLECNKIRSRADLILAQIKVLPHFERLYLNQNTLQSTVGEAIYELLTRSRSIKELRLSNNNQIGDEAGKRIAEGLLLCKNLKVCHLAENRMGNQSAYVLSEVIKRG